MARDNFSSSTKNLLGLAVGFTCVRPGCAKPTTALAQNSNAILRIDIAAHDSAAAPAGPRYDETITPEQRKAYENGAHLCPTCARLVDVDQEQFPVGTLARWQKNAAEYRQFRMHNPHPPAGLDFKTSCEAALRFINLCQGVSIDIWQKHIRWESICAMEQVIQRSLPMQVTNPYCAQFPHMVNLQLEMIAAIQLIIKEVKHSGCWNYNQIFKTYYLNSHKEIWPTPQEQIENQRIDNSFLLVKTRFEDFLENQQSLNLITKSPFSLIDLYGW